MEKLQDLSKLDGSKIKGLFFDIDDTFSSDGKISKVAFNALWDLYESGLKVIPTTGRPAGWCDHIARMWPVTAVIGENGAFYFMMRNGKLEKHYLWGGEDITSRRNRLMALLKKIQKKFPHAVPPSDQNYREFDLSVDVCEDIPCLPESEVDEIMNIMKDEGAIVKLSSIHVNCWFGDYDKLMAAKEFAKRELKTDLDKDNISYAFAGDSPNDEPMFAFFKNGVGVQNVSNFLSKMKNHPTFITKGKSGDGFAELVRQILKGR